MILGLIAISMLVGGISAIIALKAGYSVVIALTIYSACGGLSMLAAAGIVFALSGIKSRLNAERRKPQPPQQADAPI